MRSIGNTGFEAFVTNSKTVNFAKKERERKSVP